MTHIRERRDTMSNWTIVNPVLMLGEMGWETDSVPPRVKLGDGVTAWTGLPYAITQGHSTTTSRPSASTLGVGAAWYDTTLSKPIWSDGAVWRDALGNIV